MKTEEGYLYLNSIIRRADIEGIKKYLLTGAEDSNCSLQAQDKGIAEVNAGLMRFLEDYIIADEESDLYENFESLLAYYGDRYFTFGTHIGYALAMNAVQGPLQEIEHIISKSDNIETEYWQGSSAIQRDLENSIKQISETEAIIKTPIKLSLRGILNRLFYG